MQELNKKRSTQFRMLLFMRHCDCCCVQLLRGLTFPLGGVLMCLGMPNYLLTASSRTVQISGRCQE